VIIERVEPEVDGGRFPIKRVIGERVVIEANVFSDGHDALAGRLLFRPEGASRWNEVPLEPLVNDRWRAEFTVETLGRYQYTLEAWVDRFKTWRLDFAKKVAADQDVRVDLLIGVQLIEEAAVRAAGNDAQRLKTWAKQLRARAKTVEQAQLTLDDEFVEVADRYPDCRQATLYSKELLVIVDRERARCSAWYEFFPRSCAPEPGAHGTFKDCEARLDYVASMGFDVVYLPPIHPIGHTRRKGKNNATVATPDDPGSPWGIGSPDGGHQAVHPQLGTLQDFRRFLKQAKTRGLEVALDIAFQCSVDHPYVKQHPSWFRWRPDGSVQFAENPPKKYEDIYPLEFDTPDWQALWQELLSVFQFWVAQGVRIFRVDNPHTKPFAFWEWLIGEVRRESPDVILLSEAFTRPHIMYELAKLGFTQSYTYFAWRNTQWELTQYFTELTQTPVREFFRPNLWPNTPDILTEYLQAGGRPAFMTRLALAATLGANYGIYGPAFELCVNQPRQARSEEYLNSEKYEIKAWDLKATESLREFIARVNRIRRDNPALQHDWNLRFHRVDNEQLICYSKRTDDFENVVLVVVNLDPHYKQSGWVGVTLEELGVTGPQPYQVHDLLTDARYLWQGGRNYVELDPHVMPAHIFRIRRRVRREQDFEYYA